MAESWVPAVGALVAGKYRIERPLGLGGMGVVLAARHEELGHLVALKLMRVPPDESSEHVERFLREARSSAKLRSEHVTRVFDVGTLEDGTPWMVMEHLEGMDLEQHLGRHGPLPVGEACHFVVQALEALAEAHGAGIVHRDVKPANLFLTTRPNGSACIKVLDFGIARSFAAPDGARPSGITRTGTSFGSPLYMSPEQIRSAKTVDARSDLWSMGVSLFELLTGRAPFEDSDATSVMASILEKDVPRAATFRADIPADLDDVLMRALAKDPARRYQSASDMQEALSLFDAAPARSDAAARASGRRREGPARAADLALATSQTMPAPTGPTAVDRASGPLAADTGKSAAAPSRWRLVLAAAVTAALCGAVVLTALRRSGDTLPDAHPAQRDADRTPSRPDVAPSPIEPPPPVDVEVAPSSPVPSSPRAVAPPPTFRAAPRSRSATAAPASPPAPVTPPPADPFGEVRR